MVGALLISKQAFATWFFPLPLFLVMAVRRRRLAAQLPPAVDASSPSPPESNSDLILMSTDLWGDRSRWGIPNDVPTTITRYQMATFISFRDAVRGCMRHEGQHTIRAMMHRIDDDQRFHFFGTDGEVRRFRIESGARVLRLVKKFWAEVWLVLMFTPLAEERAIQLVNNLCDSLLKFDADTNYPDGTSIFHEIETAHLALLPLRLRYSDVCKAVLHSSRLKLHKCTTEDGSERGVPFLTFIKTLLLLVQLSQRYSTL
jgi:hypothetical protein